VRDLVGNELLKRGENATTSDIPNAMHIQS